MKAWSAAGQQGGKRGPLGIGLIAGKADHHRGRRDAGGDLDFQIGAHARAPRSRAGAFKVMRENAQTVAGYRFHAGGEVAQGGLEIAGVEVGRVFQHHPGGEAAHEHGAGAAARALKVISTPSRVRLHRPREWFRRGAVGSFSSAHAVGLCFGFRRLVLRLGLRLCFRFCTRRGLGSVSWLCPWAPASLAAVWAMACAWAVLAPPWRRSCDGRLGGAGRGIGRDIGLGRQDVQDDFVAVLEIVIAGIAIGIELHHGAAAVQAPGGVLHPGRREAGDHRHIGSRAGAWKRMSFCPRRETPDRRHPCGQSNTRRVNFS